MGQLRTAGIAGLATDILAAPDADTNDDLRHRQTGAGTGRGGQHG